MNLIEGLQKEANRRREILPEYEAIPVGAFGAAMLKNDIQKIEKVIASGDTIEMLSVYKQMSESSVD